MKKLCLVLGPFLLFGALAGGNLKYMRDWNTAELTGFNMATLFMIFGGAYMTYWGLFGKREPPKSN